MSKNICKVALLIALGMFGLNAVAAETTPVTGKDVVKKEDKDAKKSEDQQKKPEVPTEAPK